jgi:hypothetical protein
METQERMLRRSELYALVWEKAVQRVAADIGVSDVAVAKACRKHQIPVPERGYWRRKEWGYKVKQPLLSALPNGSDPWITFHATTRSKDTTNPKVLSPEEQFEQRPENRVVVPDTLDHLSLSVRHTGAVLRQQKPDDHGLVDTSAKECFRVQVSPASLDRAMRILQALVDAFGVRGHELVDGDEHGSGLRVRVQGEVVTMRLTEGLTRVPRMETEKEAKEKGRNPAWQRRIYDWVPNGKLVLRIGNAPGYPQHAMFRDRANDPLEQRLNGFLARLAESAVLIKVRREAEEQRARERVAKQKAREEARMKVAVERARFRRVEHLARLWQRREALLGFVSAVKEGMKDARPELVPAAQAWVNWMEAHLEERNPVDVLFFEPLLGPESPDLNDWVGGDRERDEWLDEWGDVPDTDDEDDPFADLG